MTVPLADSSSLPDDGQTDGYRTVSPWAVAALVLGIISPLAFVGPVLWLLPWLCIAIALLAMWKISASARELAGWNIALLGLLMALLFGVAAPVHTLTRHYWLESRAEAFAKQFVDLLHEGRPLAAYQLMLYPALRKPLDADFSALLEKNSNARQKYDDFLQTEPARTLLAQRSQATVEQLDSHWLSSDDDGDQVAVPYRILHPENGARAPLVVQLTLLRSLEAKTGREQWRIKSADVVK